MSDAISDFMVHVNESLSTEQLKRLDECVHGDPCVVSAGFSQTTPCLMTVVYDCECTHAKDILDHVREAGVHASML